MAARTEALKLRDDELFITRSFDAPLSIVWRMWQEPEHMIRWRVGMISSMFPKSWSSGEYLEIEPHKRIVLSFAWDDNSGETVPTTITVQFEERAGRTAQHFHQTPFTSVASRDSHVGGWNSLFNKQQLYAENFAVWEKEGRRR